MTCSPLSHDAEPRRGLRCMLTRSSDYYADVLLHSGHGAPMRHESIRDVQQVLSTRYRV